MKKAICFLLIMLSGCDFVDEIIDFFKCSFQGKAYIVSRQNNKESIERIKSELQSFDIMCDKSELNSLTLSGKHKEVWQKIIENNESQAIIFEDNVYFEKYFKRNLQKYIQDLPQGWDIAFLVIGRENDRYGYFISVGDIFRDIDEVKGHPYVAQIQKTNRVFGLYGYIVNQQGARKLLKLIKNESKNISDIIFQNGGVNTGYIKAYVSMFKLIEPKITQTNVDYLNFRKQLIFPY